MSQPPVDPNLWDTFQARWRAQEDDLIGGWCITMEAETRTPAEGAVSIGSFLTQHLAQYVCAMHNWAVESGETAIFIRDMR